jgi:hypothetical protein
MIDLIEVPVGNNQCAQEQQRINDKKNAIPTGKMGNAR